MANRRLISKVDILNRFGVKESNLVQLYWKYGVKFLAVFGSIVLNELQLGKSDIDFLVEFDSTSVDKFLDLQDSLRNLFHFEKVDLVTVASLKNKVMRQEFLSSQKRVYAA